MQLLVKTDIQNEMQLLVKTDFQNEMQLSFKNFWFFYFGEFQKVVCRGFTLEIWCVQILKTESIGGVFEKKILIAWLSILLLRCRLEHCREIWVWSKLVVCFIDLTDRWGGESYKLFMYVNMFLLFTLTTLSS